MLNSKSLHSCMYLFQAYLDVVCQSLSYSMVFHVFCTYVYLFPACVGFSHLMQQILNGHNKGHPMSPSHYVVSYGKLMLCIIWQNGFFYCKFFNVIFKWLKFSDCLFKKRKIYKHDPIWIPHTWFCFMYSAEPHVRINLQLQSSVWVMLAKNNCDWLL